jgi:hypothetical protein
MYWTEPAWCYRYSPNTTFLKFMTAGLLWPHLLRQWDNMRTETDRQKQNNSRRLPAHVTKTATQIALMLQNFLSPLTMVQFQDCSWFIKLCCLCHMPKEEFLVLHFRTRKCCLMCQRTQICCYLSFTSIERASEISNLQLQTAVLFPVGPAKWHKLLPSWSYSLM